MRQIWTQRSRRDIRHWVSHFLCCGPWLSRGRKRREKVHATAAAENHRCSFYLDDLLITKEHKYRIQENHRRKRPRGKSPAALPGGCIFCSLKPWVTTLWRNEETTERVVVSSTPLNDHLFRSVHDPFFCPTGSQRHRSVNPLRSDMADLKETAGGNTKHRR